MAVVFTSDTAKRVLAATREVEAQVADHRRGPRQHQPAIVGDFYGWITGVDMAGRFSFVRVIPTAFFDSPDIITKNDLRFDIAIDGSPYIHVAYELNGAMNVPLYTVVRLTPNGFNADEDQVFIFQQQTPPILPDSLPLHDHRDNSPMSGGFAFCVYAPGTSLPQQSWSA